MAAAAKEPATNKDMKQGRLPFKVLDIKIAFQCPNTPQLKRKRNSASSEDGKSPKSFKSDNSNKTTDLENLTSDLSKHTPVILNSNHFTKNSEAVGENEVMVLDSSCSLEAANHGALTRNLEELEMRKTVEDVLRNNVIEMIDKLPKSVAENNMCDELNSSITSTSSIMNSSIQSELSDLNDSTNADKSLEIVSEISNGKKDLSQKSRDKRKEETQRLRSEKERKLAEARELKKKLVEEARAKRLQEKQEIKRKRLQEKEEVRQKLLMKKEQEQREREEKMQQKLQAKEKEKEEKQRLVDEKKQQLSLKLEEKRRKEEEKQKKLDEKKKLEEEVERKKKKVKAVFASFFIKNEPSIQTQQEQLCGLFKPFEVKKDMMLASVIPASVSSCFDPMRLEACLRLQDCEKLYIQELQTKSHKPYKTAVKTMKSDDISEDVLILEEKKETIPAKAKVFHFCENIRPLYWRTWRKKSQVVKPRNPFSKDSFLDYEVDSDEEWDEGGPGESLSGTEDEKESEDDYEVDNEFFVPHGYLSADEEKDEDSPDSPEMHQARLKMREKEFEEDLKRKCSQLKPRLLGCLWSRESNEELYKALSIYQAIVLSPLPIISSQGSQNGSSLLTSSPIGDPQKKRQPKCFPEEAMPHLIQLLHANKYKKPVLIKEFQEFWSTQCAQKMDCVEQNSDVDNKENKVVESPTSPTLSKGLLELTIKRIATYIKNPNLKGCCWWVNEEIRNRYNVTDLPEVNRWQYVSFKEPEVLPVQVKSPSESIMKFARKITPTRLDLSLSPTPEERNNVKDDVKVSSNGTVSVSKTPGKKLTMAPEERNFVKADAKKISANGSVLVSKTPGKKRTMSILHFAKRLKTVENSEPSNSKETDIENCSTADETIKCVSEKAITEDKVETSIPLNAKSTEESSFDETTPDKKVAGLTCTSTSTVMENCSVDTGNVTVIQEETNEGNQGASIAKRSTCVTTTSNPLGPENKDAQKNI